ncbi:MAG: E3 binding domain-containing protein, partial [SAR324 cluster bacterium]|nr:E3 binding domain-containing protein [SAR324 cluster bacterium]
MATLITLPQFGPDMESGVISSWNKNVGDFVEAGDLLAEVETDKAVFEFEVEEGGFLREILVPAGEEIAVGTPIAVLAASKDEDISALLGRAPAATPPATQPAPQASPTPVASAPVAGVPAAPASVGGNGGGQAGDRVKISPHARKLAEQGNIDVALLTGTGPSGRIVAQDVEVAISSGTASGDASGIAAGAGPSARAAVAAAPSAGAPAGGRIKISPYGRRLAREHGIDVALLTGTGPTGRIVARCVEAAIS